jgi:hypothetical protein
MRNFTKILIVFVLQLTVFQILNAQQSQNNTAAVSLRPKFIHITEMGFLLGSQAPINNNYNKLANSYYYPYQLYTTDRYSNFSLQHFSGVNIHNAVAIGATAGFDYYRANIITPLSFGIRSTLTPSRRISPIGNFDIGYGFIWKNEADKQSKNNKTGGLMLNPSAGLRIKIGNDGSTVNINVGYRLQKSESENNIEEQDYYQTEYRTFKRLSIRLGLGF